MKAAVVKAFDQPLWIWERLIPTPAHGQVPVKMKTCSVCRTGIRASPGESPARVHGSQGGPDYQLGSFVPTWRAKFGDGTEG